MSNRSNEVACGLLMDYKQTHHKEHCGCDDVNSYMLSPSQPCETSIDYLLFCQQLDPINYTIAINFDLFSLRSKAHTQPPPECLGGVVLLSNILLSFLTDRIPGMSGTSLGWEILWEYCANSPSNV